MVLMPFSEANDFPSAPITRKHWRRWRLLHIPLMLFIAGPAVLITGTLFGIGACIGYLVNKKLFFGPDVKPFHVMVWNWLKSFARWCARFWSEGPTIDGNWDPPKRTPAGLSSKTLPCSVCGKPVQLSIKYAGRSKTATCSDCAAKRLSGKTLPCVVCGKPIFVPAKFGRATWARHPECK